MSSASDQIWEGDKLERRSEAARLERFLIAETAELVRMGREQAFVLALDAQYGEGKSWFLARFSRQLETNHPVAFVDAWVDDANNEPLVSIMAALDDALKPFLKNSTVREKFGAMARAALPIMGKGVVAFGGKFVTKHIGDQFGDDASAALETAKKAAIKKDEKDDPLNAGLDKLVEGVAGVVDNAGKALLEQYRARQKSRETFKQNLRQLAASINQTDADPRKAPIFVVVDELDRCRPDYAISLLEEIKHLFDVPGVVFVIALHGQQLTKSIEAVYGAHFDATSYLRRFFTRHYELRRLHLSELVATHFDQIGYDQNTFAYPPIWTAGGKIETVSPAAVAGLLLTEWRATPREVQSVIDGLRLFVGQWDHPKTPIELPLALVLLLNLVRGHNVAPKLDTVGPNAVTFGTPADPTSFNAPPGRGSPSEFFEAYELGMSNNLPQLVKNEYSTGVFGYVGARMLQEYATRFGSRHMIGVKPPLSTWAEYPERVRELGRFVEPKEDEANPLLAPGREPWS